MNDYTIRLEEKKDHRDVENLIRESFWNVYRPGCSEHYVIICSIAVGIDQRQAKSGKRFEKYNRVAIANNSRPKQDLFGRMIL